MKRLTAILLSAAMLLSLVGCTKAEETTKKKKTKTKKTTTEETETEETDPPVDTTDETTDEPTSDTTETTSETTETTSDTTSDTSATSAPTPVAGEVKSLHSMLIFDTLTYGELDDNDGYPTVINTTVYAESIQVMDPNATKLAEFVDDHYSALADYLSAAYDEFLDDFLEGRDTAKHYMKLYMYRDDSYICSFVEGTSVYSVDGSMDIYTAYNVLTETGEVITFTDVIKDASAVADVVQKNIPSKMTPASDEFLGSIRNGTCPFALTYDGIVFFTTEYNLPIKVNYTDIANLVDDRFFGYNPETFVLDLDLNSSLVYDINGDGQDDTVKVDVSYASSDYFDVKDVTLTYNGNSTTLTAEECGYLYGDYDPNWDTSYIMHVNGGDFLYLPFTVEDDYTDYYVFNITDGAFTFVDTLDYEFYGHPCDPDAIWMMGRTDILGTSYYKGDFSFNGGDGLAYDEDTVFYNMHTKVQTKAEVYGVNMDGNDASIPAGTPVLFVAYNKNEKEVLLMTLDKDYNNDEYLIVTVETGNYPILISGYDQGELFDGIHYAG
ncbi:MAG: hypothetical protein J5379_01905 [Clostridiales bacterium]|nr:hypothetical protein [Clostridiales bacterium]